MENNDSTPAKKTNRLTDKDVVKLCDYVRANADAIRRWTGTDTALAGTIGGAVGIQGLTGPQLKLRLSLFDIEIGADAPASTAEIALLRSAVLRNEREISELRKAIAELQEIGGVVHILPAAERSPLETPGTLPFDDEPAAPTTPSYAPMSYARR